MFKFTIYLLRVLSGTFFIYFLLVLLISGYKTSFLWFWPAAGAAAGLLSVLLPSGLKSRTAVLSVGSLALQKVILAGFILFLIAEIGLVLFSLRKPANNADYVIILGAQVRGDIPSKTLDIRIQTAADYLLDHPAALAICSGGQGSSENITEAKAIARRLIELGIGQERILLEEQSTSTVENLSFSKKLCRPQTDQVVIVTSDFHLFRACRIAKKLGYSNISGLGAREFLITTPGYYVREFFALIKELISGNL